MATLDYDARLRLRRACGVVVPVLLLPVAAWFFVSTPPAALADPPAAPGSPAPSTAAAEPGVTVRASVLPDGSFDVVETVVVAQQVVELTLAPRDLTGAGPSFGSAAATYSDVEVAADGEGPVSVPTLTRPVTVPLSAPTTQVEVRYRLSGTSVRTEGPSAQGRALGALAPLTQGDDPVGFEFGGARLLTLTCPLLPPDEVLCGVDEAGTVVAAPRPADLALVVAQLDLDS